ncbi:hypothetical protein PTTG_07702 [Puccinia triticina 1-1 BBBD Race 1]|uniref:Peptidase S59 domain-containing protein n=2 Tax=Puccinia triticina TaxID=208348 RepID=A0A180H1N3_PUCT1|nr:uncharacterized protein PtA15_2A936 [Puccinia triticina]OAV98684.1 hypothetical protein PTTG_07702 [Puccinia triticina 1-1 BBBD Race 1]WAQ82619.1 hypothetical protein PtA15_2A936 [Puccinia triticina]
MFGASNNTFGGFNAANQQQPQQQQQQQQQPTGGLFGGTPANTSFNTFGQQPAGNTFTQQPQATGFGNNAFGAPASSTPFGQTPAPANNLFGQPQTQSSNIFGASPQPQQAPPNTGFGGFGAAPTNTFGTFGATTNTATPSSNLFGQKPAASTPTFGAGTATGFGSNVFNQNTASPFGATGPSAPSSGTVNPPYAPVTLAENESTPSSKSTFNSIVAMDAYKNFSFEELRFQDYMQGRKTAVPSNTLGTGFGTQQQPQTGAFGTFGNANNTNTQVGAFGQQQQPQANIFGGAPSSNTFGAQPAANRNIFGQPANTTSTPFGQAQAPATSNAFGAAAAPAATTFGSNNMFNNNATNGSPFGAPAAKPNIFGSATTQTPFGAPAASAAPTTGIFGSTPAQPQNNLFGAANNQNGGGLFGNANNNNATQPAGGLFGANTNQNNAQKPAGLFGGGLATGSTLFGQQTQAANTTNTFGFGQNNQQQTTGGLFGNNNQTQPNASGGLFGQNNNQQGQNTTSGGLFGSNNANNPTPNTGGLFGSNTNNNNAASGGLFGQKPANPTVSLFGNKDAGAQNNNTNFGGTTGGLFGAQQTGSTFGIGNNQNQSNNSGGNMFGQANNPQMFQSQQNGLFQSQQAQQPTLQARVDRDAYGNNPLFANHGISAGCKPAIPIRKQLPTIDFKPLPRPNTKIVKLRGFARSASPVKNVSSGSPMNASSVSNGSSVVSRSSAYSRHEEPLLSPKAFIVKPSPKKLTIDPSTISTLFRNRSTTINGSPSSVQGTPPPPRKNTAINRPESVFDPDAESSARNVFSAASHGPTRSVGQASESNNAAKQSSAVKSPTNSKNAPNLSGSNQLTTDNEINSDRVLMEDEVVIRSKSQAKDGEYWILPSIDELRLMKRKDLKAVPNFKAGRVGYGQIEFRETVDLSGLEDFSTDLCGEIIVFKQSLCSVYPDDPVDKPPVGKGLNVPAVITLDNCWVLDKATRMPIKDPNHARVKLFTKRLMKSEDTEFIEYDAQTGKWTFTVEHFTTYGIDDSDEESNDDDDEDEDQEGESYVRSESEDDLSGLDHRHSRLVRPLHEMTSNGNSISDENEDDGPPRAMLFDDEQESLPLHKENLPTTHGQLIDRSEDETTASVTGSDDRESPFMAKHVSKKRPRQGVDSENSLDNDPSKQASSSDWRNSIGLESRKVAVMQASLFARPDSSRARLQLTPKVPSKTQTAPSEDPRRARNTSRQPPSHTPEPRQITNTHTNIPTPSPHVPVKKHLNVPVRLRYPQYIPLSKSLAFGKCISNKSPSLSMARSFRVCWIGQSNQVIHPARGEIGNILDTSNLQNTSFGHLAVSTISCHAFENSMEIKSAQRLLEIQLKHSTIRLEEGVPNVMTNPNLKFRDFLASYDKADRSNDALTWGLCSALFDELELRIPKGASPGAVDRIKRIRREDAFTKWLEKTVAPSVEQDVRSPSRQQGKFSAIFQLLTGNQIERACELAIQTDNYRLATLIAQCRRSDATFKTDMHQQTQIWRQLRVDAHIDRDLRKTYELISGNVTMSKGSGKKGLQVDHSEDIGIGEGLDWKRALGLHFWFLAPDDNVWLAVQTYEDAFKNARCTPPPIPWYMDSSTASISEPVPNRWKLDPDQPVYDAIFQILKIFVDPTYPLESVLEPRGFGPSPFDYRMPWHLYILIAKVMRLRDFEDREPIMRDIETYSDDTSLSESGSVSADILTSQYADQLNKLGLIKWAGFILLHLENPEGRARALKELISRNIKAVTGDVEDFFVDKLKIPSTWIYLARAQVAHYEGRFFEEYHLLLKSSRINEAHKIVVLELAPDAILRGDLKLIRNLFCGKSNIISSSELTGVAKAFMDFVKVVEGLQFLNASNGATALTARGKRSLDNQVDQAQNREEIEEMLGTKVSNLIKEIPLIFNEFSNANGLTVKQQVCINEMMSSLINLIECNPRSLSLNHNAIRDHQRTSNTPQKPYHYLNSNNTNLINIKDLKTSDQVLFIQNFSHENFLKTLQNFPPLRSPPTTTTSSPILV